MKKLYLILFSTLLCLTACGKTEEELNDEHNYAVNPVTYSNDTSDSIVTDDNINTVDINDTNNNNVSTISENTEVSYSYPDESNNNKYFVNYQAVASIPSYRFKFNDITVSSNDLENVYDICTENNFYAHSYEDTLNLSDNENDYDSLKLSLFIPAVDYIQLGENQYDITDFIYPKSDFNKLIDFCNNHFVSYHNKSDNIFAYADDMYSSGNYYRYTWIYYVDDAKLEYSGDTINQIKSLYANLDTDEEDKENTNTDVEFSSLLDTKLYIYADVNDNNDVVNYTIEVVKFAHFWQDNVTVTNYTPIPTGNTIKVPFDKNGDEIPEDELDNYDKDEITYEELPEYEYKESINYTDEKKFTHSGFDFTYSYIKLKDGTSIGLDNFSITINN